MLTQTEALLGVEEVFDWMKSSLAGPKDHNENLVDFPSQPKQIKEQLEAVFSFTETMWAQGQEAPASEERGAPCVVRVPDC